VSVRLVGHWLWAVSFVVWTTYLVAAYVAYDFSAGMLTWDAAFAPSVTSDLSIQWGSVGSEYLIGGVVAVVAAVIAATTFFILARSLQERWPTARSAMLLSTAGFIGVFVLLSYVLPADAYFDLLILALIPRSVEQLVVLVAMSVLAATSAFIGGQIGRVTLRNRQAGAG